MKKHIIFQTILLPIVLLLSINSFSQNWNQVIKTAASDREAFSTGARSNDYFGFSVAIDGDYAVVGAPFRAGDENGSPGNAEAGAAYIFLKNAGTWTFLKKIAADDYGYRDNFGVAVAIHGDVVAVGAYKEDQALSGPPFENSGSVYIFSKDQGGANNWGQIKKIKASDPANFDLFGSAVAVNGNYLIVGAQEEDEDATGMNTLSNSGSVYIFSKDHGGANNWGQIKKIVANDRAAGDFFGYSVSLSSNNIVVGAYNEDEDAAGINTLNNAGSAYIFSKDAGGINNWGQVKKIVATNRAATDFFGFSVAISNNLIVVGAYQEDENGAGMNTLSNAGSAYIFSKDAGGIDNWGQIKKIVATDRATTDFFGYSVAIEGNSIVIGAYQEDQDVSGGATLSNAGSAYIFNKDEGGTDNWGQVQKMVATDRAVDDYFGFSVSISGSSVLTGAYLDDAVINFEITAPLAGAAYIHYKDEGGINNWGQVEKLVLIDKVDNQNYGSSVSVNGNYAVVGAPGDPLDDLGQNPQIEAGAAYVLKNINGIWTEIKKIVASDRRAIDNFGFSVAISDTIIVVGANLQDEYNGGVISLREIGSAYIYSKNQGGIDNWGQVKKIVASNKSAAHRFGYTVAINDTIVVVGAINEGVTPALPTFNAGAAYVYTKDNGGINNWGEAKKLTAPIRAAHDKFGSTISINGGNIVVGAHQEDEDENETNTLANAGAAYIFNQDAGGINNWGFVKKIVASDRAANDFFAYSVSINNDQLIIGAPQEDENATGGVPYFNPGSAYIFSKDEGGIANWGQIKKIVAADRSTDQNFGYAVGISGNTAIAGAVKERTDGIAGSISLIDAGAAYVFQKDEGNPELWVQQKKLVASDRAVSDYFGNSVSIDGATVLIGALNEGENAEATNHLFRTGSAYFFKGDCFTADIASTNSKVIGLQNRDKFNTIFFNNNCDIITTIEQNGTTPIQGHINTKVWIETIQPSSFVKRHYEITPITNTATATAKLTIYFTQAEFDDFNAINSTKLPISPTDAAGIGNLRIEKRAGSSADGTGLPSSYPGAIASIDPIDSDITWNPFNNYWEVSFNVTGFSGFFVKTQSAVLPLKWLSIAGTLNSQNQATINWKVQEINVSNYAIEKSTDGTAFNKIGTVSSAGDGTHSYSFTELNVLQGIAFYRIKQTDNDGKVSYSATVKLSGTRQNEITIYPNPVKNIVTINGVDNLFGTTLMLMDVSGKLINEFIISHTSFTVDMEKYASGIYYFKFGNGNVRKIVKQ